MDPDDCLEGSLSDLENHVVELANLAINFDKQQKWDAAKFYYQVTLCPLLSPTNHFVCLFMKGICCRVDKVNGQGIAASQSRPKD